MFGLIAAFSNIHTCVNNVNKVSNKTEREMGKNNNNNNFLSSVTGEK